MDVRESRVLAALRDALLHKLVSGEMMAQTRSRGGQGNYPTWPAKSDLIRGGRSQPFEGERRISR